MNKILLITRPDHEITTRYLSAWSGKIIELARKKNIQVMDLKRDKANLKELKSRAAKMRPLFIILNGHGSESLPESNQYAKFLWWDMKHQVCLGDGNSKFN